MLDLVKNFFINLYSEKLRKLISKENQFFIENPHLKSFKTTLVATIIVIFYIGILTFSAMGLASLLSLLKVPHANYISIGIAVLVFICITIKDIKNNPIKKRGGKKMNKKAWFGLDPRLELLIAAIILFLILVKLGIIKMG